MAMNWIYRFLEMDLKKNLLIQAFLIRKMLKRFAEAIT